MKRFELELRSCSTGYLIEVWDNSKNDYLTAIALGRLTFKKAQQTLCELDTRYNRTV